MTEYKFATFLKLYVESKDEKREREIRQVTLTQEAKYHRRFAADFRSQALTATTIQGFSRCMATADSHDSIALAIESVILSGKF